MRMDASVSFPTDPHARRCPLFHPTLTPEQQAEAQRIEDILMEAARQEIHAIALLLASKPDHKLLGKTEFEVRDRVHKIGAKAIETALNERKKGGTKGPA
jgi:hypothetical protein